MGGTTTSSARRTSPDMDRFFQRLGYSRQQPAAPMPAPQTPAFNYQPMQSARSPFPMARFAPFPMSGGQQFPMPMPSQPTPFRSMPGPDAMPVTQSQAIDTTGQLQKIQPGPMAAAGATPIPSIPAGAMPTPGSLSAFMAAFPMAGAMTPVPLGGAPGQIAGGGPFAAPGGGSQMATQSQALSNVAASQPQGMAYGGAVDEALRLARGEVLSDRFPSQYLPEVGRQVMANGGVPRDDAKTDRELFEYANELDKVQRRQDLIDSLSETLPGRIARSVASAVTAPRDAYFRGMTTDEMISRAQDMSGLVMGGGLGATRPSGSIGMGGRSMPPAENSRLTQIATTGPSYAKALSNLERAGIEGPVIDYGAGRGHGLRHIAADTFEPYPSGWSPTFMRPEDIPDEAYRRLINLNVLNVLSPEAREMAVRNMGRIIAPEGGGIISTRGRDVLSARGVPGPEPMSMIVGEGNLARYQKGFTPKELREYVGDVLGSNFDVMPSDVGQASVLFRRARKRGGSIVDRALMVVSKKT